MAEFECNDIQNSRQMSRQPLCIGSKETSLSNDLIRQLVYDVLSNFGSRERQET